MDPKCNENSLACVLCIKNKHRKCDDNLVILKQDAKEKVVILENIVDPHIITGRLNQILELKLYELSKSLMNKKKAFISSFNIDQQNDDIFDLEILRNIKKNFNFEFNEEK